MSMNAVVISLFLGGLALCIVTGASLLWALAFGLLCFTGHAFRLGFRPREIVGLCGRGVRTIGNILKIFVLIGMLTAVWRSAGTIPYIIHHCLPWVDPAHFHLWVFLLCSLLSLLLGTSFGTASTLGVVFMLLARTAGLDPLLTAGAVMSGIYVGDRSSPMSSSAALVCALTGTSIYDNVRLMWRTSLLPFFLVCLAYVLLPSARAESLPHVDGLFADGLVLDARALLP
ncbi:Na+/H+ antiporter NhaC family protein, partial [Desulfovibrio sp.]